MSLKKCVRIAIGILASSGVAAILSGGALAASSGQDTISQNVRIQQGTAGVPQAPGESGTGNYFQRSQLDGNGRQGVPEDSGVIGSDGTDTGSSQTVTGGQAGSGSNTIGTQVTDSSDAKAAQQPVKASAAKGNSDQGQGGSFVSGGTSDGGAMGVGGGNGSSVAAVSEVAVVTPVSLPQPLPGVQPTTRTTILPIQPDITNRSAALTPDLAETMPSAPTPARVPVPAKSSGVLAGLVVGLSNVVVPQPVTPADTVWLKLMLAVGLLTLVVLLVNVFEFSYGQWLRRGGFATAARSDEPLVSSTTSLFATPLLSGYVEQPPRLHNPILLVVLVPNAYRKEDRR